MNDETYADGVLWVRNPCRECGGTARVYVTIRNRVRRCCLGCGEEDTSDNRTYARRRLTEAEIRLGLEIAEAFTPRSALDQ